MLNTVKVSWNGAPRRVTAPFIIEFLTPMVCSGRVAFFGIRAQTGGKFHLKLNMTARLIVNKYREGKVKRTLKRELKVLEIVKGEANIAVAFASPWIGKSLESRRTCQGNRQRRLWYQQLAVSKGWLVALSAGAEANRFRYSKATAFAVLGRHPAPRPSNGWGRKGFGGNTSTRCHLAS